MSRLATLRRQIEAITIDETRPVFCVGLTGDSGDLEAIEAMGTRYERNQGEGEAEFSERVQHTLKGDIRARFARGDQ